MILSLLIKLTMDKQKEGFDFDVFAIKKIGLP